MWAGHNIVNFDSVIIRDAFAEIGRPPPEAKGMVDTLPLLTQWFGPRAGDMKVYNLLSYVLTRGSSLPILSLNSKIWVKMKQGPCF